MISVDLITALTSSPSAKANSSADSLVMTAVIKQVHLLLF